jgi:hypothetical protein
MKKIAIFVEGQTELIVVREYLLKWFEYQNIELECRTLFSDAKFHKTDYDFPNTNAEFHFQIINVGSDNNVLSRILRRESYMWNAGYERIVGLRDMYSAEYRNVSTVIDSDINDRFINSHNDTILQKAQQPERIFMRFAIMETEAWFLGLHDIFEKIDACLTVDYIQTELGLNLAVTNPETDFFHPAVKIKEIYKLFGGNYDKHKGDIEAIVSPLTKHHFEELLSKPKCNSFNSFHEAIHGE